MPRPHFPGASGRVKRLLLLALLALASPVRADDLAPPRWELVGQLVTSSSAVLDVGLFTAVGLEGRRVFRNGPFFASLRATGGLHSEWNRTWAFDDWHGQLAAGLGAAFRKGVGRVWAQAGAGAIGVYEVRRRHQYERLVANGVANAEQTGFTLGPAVFAEFGVAVDVRGAWSFGLAGGPAFTRQTVDGKAVNRFGGSCTLEVGRAF